MNMRTVAIATLLTIGIATTSTGLAAKKDRTTASSSTTAEPTSTQAPTASELPDGLDIGNQIGLAYHYGADTAWNDVLQSAVDQAIDPADYVCNAPTTFQLWANEQVGMIDPVSLTVLAMLGVPGWPADYKVILDNENSDEFIGTFGQATREQIKRHRDNQRFWDVRTDDILLMGMHGADIGDDSKMLDLINLYIAFGVLPPFLDAQTVVDTAQAVIEGGLVNLEPILGVPLVFDLPGVPGRYDHPLFTLNAFAFTDRGLGALLGIEIPDKIIMGDGLLEGLDAIGLGTNGPDFVHAHEFAHHVQFETPGAILPPAATPEDQAELTRRTELMADGFGAYYSSHARGATFQAKRFADVMNAAFVVGDCAFTNPGHHGTPDQRNAAAAWGEGVTDSQQKKGHILPATEMLDRFDANYATLIAPDAR